MHLWEWVTNEPLWGSRLSLLYFFVDSKDFNRFLLFLWFSLSALAIKCEKTHWSMTWVTTWVTAGSILHPITDTTSMKPSLTTKRGLPLESPTCMALRDPWLDPLVHLEQSHLTETTCTLNTRGTLLVLCLALQWRTTSGTGVVQALTPSSVLLGQEGLSLFCQNLQQPLPMHPGKDRELWLLNLSSETSMLTHDRFLPRMSILDPWRRWLNSRENSREQDNRNTSEDETLVKARFVILWRYFKKLTVSVGF